MHFLIGFALFLGIVWFLQFTRPSRIILAIGAVLSAIVIGLIVEGSIERSHKGAAEPAAIVARCSPTGLAEHTPEGRKIAEVFCVMSQPTSLKGAQ